MRNPFLPFGGPAGQGQQTMASQVLMTKVARVARPASGPRRRKKAAAAAPARTRRKAKGGKGSVAMKRRMAKLRSMIGKKRRR